MKACPHCAEEVQDQAVVCKHCRLEIQPKSSEKKTGKGFVNFIIGFCILSVIGGILFAIMNTDTNDLAHAVGDPIDKRVNK